MRRRQRRPKKALGSYIFISCQAVLTIRLPLATRSWTDPHSIAGYLRVCCSMETMSEKQSREKARFDSVALAGALRKAVLHHPNHELLKSWRRSKNASTNRPSMKLEGKRTPKVSRSAGRRWNTQTEPEAFTHGDSALVPPHCAKNGQEETDQDCIS